MIADLQAWIGSEYARLRYPTDPGQLDVVGIRRGAWDAWDDWLVLWDGQQVRGAALSCTTQPGTAAGSKILPGRYKHSHQPTQRWRLRRTGWPQGQTILAQWGKTPLRYEGPGTSGFRGTHIHGVIPPIPDEPGRWSEGCVVANVNPDRLAEWLAPVLAQKYVTLTILVQT